MPRRKKLGKPDNHQHEWKTTDIEINKTFTEGDKYMSYFFMQRCDCGVWRIKEFTNIEDAD